MSENKRKNLIALAKKNGNDSDLLLLDLIHDLQDDLEELSNKKETTDEDKIDKISTRLATKLAILDKGEQGDTGEQGESIVGEQGEKGDVGKDSKIVGPKGDKGERGETGDNGTDGLDGIDGKDGFDGKDGETGKVDENIVVELKDKIKELKEDITNIPRGGKILTGRYTYTPMLDRLTSFTDGSTKTFILSKAPKETTTMEVSGTDFPIILDPTVDFTVSGKTLTLTAAVSAPSSGATLICKYYV